MTLQETADRLRRDITNLLPGFPGKSGKMFFDMLAILDDWQRLKQINATLQMMVDAK